MENISISINSGEKVAFVGPSGSGKTTLLKLLLKFYKADSGDILLDGKSIKDINTTSYRNFFGYVPQEILLFSGTIQENIAWGNTEATSEDIFNAAKNAEALEFISKLDNRFATKIGEKGASLSGGERQRIALARTLLRKPKILVLDEATSSLDSLSESAIMNTINKIGSDMTTIIVAHRLSTIKNCDKIFVLKDGQLVESGDHKSLLENIPEEEVPADQPYSLRELEGLLKGLKYNLAIFVNYANQNFVRAGKLGSEQEKETWNKTAGTLNQLHKDFENKSGVDTTYNGNNLGIITSEMIPHNDQNKVPSYAVYLAADGQYHSVRQAINIQIRDEEEF